MIFEIEGEAGFRAREAQAIAELRALEGIVLATGGGVVLAEENRRLLAARGTVVYLHARPSTSGSACATTATGRCSPAAIRGRGCASSTRERDPLYREVADLVIDTGKQSVQTLAHGLLDAARRRDGNPQRSARQPRLPDPHRRRAARRRRRCTRRTCAGGASRSSPTRWWRRCICERVQAALRGAARAHRVVVPDGEQAKSWADARTACSTRCSPRAAAATR